jgi:Protein of unknown function (DUF3606)
MADDKSKRGRQDRSRISQSDPYEISDFQRKHGISREQAERIIQETRGNRQKADEEAAKLSR